MMNVVLCTVRNCDNRSPNFSYIKICLCTLIYNTLVSKCFLYIIFHHTVLSYHIISIIILHMCMQMINFI